MATVETNIWLALRARLEALTLDPVLTIAWPNEKFDAPQSINQPDNYLKVDWLPNTTEISTIGTGGDNRHFGIFQVTVMAKKDQNFAIALDIAGTIADHFKLSTTAFTFGITTVRVERPPSIGSLFVGDTMAELPVTIRYFADAIRT